MTLWRAVVLFLIVVAFVVMIITLTGDKWYVPLRNRNILRHVRGHRGAYDFEGTIRAAKQPEACTTITGTHRIDGTADWQVIVTDQAAQLAGIVQIIRNEVANYLPQPARVRDVNEEFHRQQMKQWRTNVATLTGVLASQHFNRFCMLVPQDDDR